MRSSIVALSIVFSACHFLAQDASPTTQPKKDAVDEKTIRALIVELGDDSFDKRVAAQKRLAAIGLPALDMVRHAAKEGTDLETRERAAQLVQEISQLLYRGTLKDKLWGASVDPDGDCGFRVAQGNLHIIIPGKPHRLSIEAGATNAPRVLHAIDGDFRAEVQVRGAFPPDTKSLVGKNPWCGAGLLVWQDEKNYIRLERARMHVPPNSFRCYANWEMRSGGKFTRKGAGSDGLLDDTKPAYFKLARQGSTFTGAYSQDGQQWQELPPIEAEFGKKLSVGVGANQNTASVFESVFEGLKITSGGKTD
ncbi:MAG TPA: hypothetical protein VNX28_17395 [Gemmataceae bacterium]|jgi:hypothetical protein|nr:hypothetical protein [Gemmataceae bacterium]